MPVQNVHFYNGFLACNKNSWKQVRIPRIFPGGGADPEAMYNLCLILKIMLQKSCLSTT
jgi:hypothetical protein